MRTPKRYRCVRCNEEIGDKPFVQVEQAGKRHAFSSGRETRYTVMARRHSDPAICEKVQGYRPGFYPRDL